MNLMIPETIMHQMKYTKVERFHRTNGKYIDVYTEGEYQIIDHNETIVVEDETDSDLWYEVVMFGEVILFVMYSWLPILNENGVQYADFIDEISLDLLIDWDIIIVDTDAEIFITRNWDVYRIPFRYLLKSGTDDKTREKLEFLGNYTPSVLDRILGLTEIRGRDYDIDRLCQ